MRVHRRSHQQPLRVLAVGQTPPPFGGQALAIQCFVTGHYEDIEIHHVRMTFSRSMSDIGRPQLAKIGHLVGLIPRILWARLRTGADLLYYPPAGPDLVPVMRDIVLLLGTRWAFSRTVFHFHASGLSEIYPRLPRWLRTLFLGAYRRPDLAISPSRDNPPDGEFLGARRCVVIPNGVADAAQPPFFPSRAEQPARILYVGVVRESKGVLVLLAACAELQRRGVEFRVALMGEVESPALRSRLQQTIQANDLVDRVELLGPRTGTDKIEWFAKSSVFCYPTHFESESFGLVLLEAMQFALPVVATRWRGVPSVVRDGETGFLVPTRDPACLADALEKLIRNPAAAQELGRRGRARFEAEFTEERFRSRMRSALLELHQEHT